MSLSEKNKELAKQIFIVDMKDNMAYIKVKNKNIRNVNKKCLECLSLIMKECGNVSFSKRFWDCKNISVINFTFKFNTCNVTKIIVCLVDVVVWV